MDTMLGTARSAYEIVMNCDLYVVTADILEVNYTIPLQMKTAK
jgi:hypothetical protein